MKEITLKIPKKILEFFMELFKQLGIEMSVLEEISEKHKSVVKVRINRFESNPERLLSRDDEKDNFKFEE